MVEAKKEILLGQVKIVVTKQQIEISKVGDGESDIIVLRFGQKFYKPRGPQFKPPYREYILRSVEQADDDPDLQHFDSMWMVCENSAGAVVSVDFSNIHITAESCILKQIEWSREKFEHAVEDMINLQRALKLEVGL